MLSLQDLLGPDRGDTALSEISNTVGAEPSLVSSAIQMALPAIIGGLANNAADPQGAQSLDQALARDHDGSIFDNLGGLGSLIFGQLQSPEPTPPQLNAGGILGHILGTNQGPVVEQVSQNTGLNMGQVAQILMMIAPLVMGYLGQQKRQQNVGADGLGGLLGGLLSGQSAAAPQSSGNMMMDMASSMLDSDRDGSAMDDIASMALNYITKR
ncbi:DUF937 domain-containing protein [Leptolyngbya sp. 7M]|uniref:DUF937 domain-containing protein n=1 Tax=Leptolyngbya sp. 7M TaxID=2812896 RepID=UPI001B8B7175|nr:DUF937 domain-containing protein [Leptolyngbya sp. 7M]QYO67258.1 DUF937 domain-containing protein [Leptolyngbya sp. 7M]